VVQLVAPENYGSLRIISKLVSPHYVDRVIKIKKGTWQASALTTEHFLSSIMTVLFPLKTTSCAQFSVWFSLFGCPKLQREFSTEFPLEHHLKLVKFALNPFVQ